MSIKPTPSEQIDTSFSSSTYMSGGSADTSFSLYETRSQISIDTTDSRDAHWRETGESNAFFQNESRTVKLKIKEISNQLDWAFRCLFVRIGVLEKYANPNSQQHTWLREDKNICLAGLEATEELQRLPLLEPRVYLTENQSEQDLSRLEKVGGMVDRLVKGFGIVKSRIMQIQDRIFPIA